MNVSRRPSNPGRMSRLSRLSFLFWILVSALAFRLSLRLHISHHYHKALDDIAHRVEPCRSTLAGRYACQMLTTGACRSAHVSRPRCASLRPLHACLLGQTHHGEIQQRANPDALAACSTVLHLVCLLLRSLSCCLMRSRQALPFFSFCFCSRFTDLHSKALSGRMPRMP